jgi:hypothetical protein
MPQPCCFGIARSLPWIRKREELDLIHAIDGEVELIGIAFLPVDFGNDGET